jgi:steroid 5-alpha reductase family enzyme
MGLAMIIPDFLFYFYRKVNYFGEVLVFFAFYFVGYGHREREYGCTPPHLANGW